MKKRIIGKGVAIMVIIAVIAAGVILVSISVNSDLGDRQQNYNKVKTEADQEEVGVSDHGTASTSKEQEGEWCHIALEPDAPGGVEEHCHGADVEDHVH